MRPFQLIFAFFFLILSQSYAQTDYSISISQSEKIIKEVMRDANLPGLAVAISIKGELVWSKGFGYSDIEKEIPVSPSESKFRIGSVSKPLTAYGLALLYQQGKVDLEVPIQRYVPDFPKKKWEINLRQLAGHTAGIRHYRGNEFLSDKSYPTVGEGLDIFKNDALIFEPETKYSYSSYGWNLISAAIENIANEPFLQYMEKKVFMELKMNNTEADYANKENLNRTKFYQLAKGEITEAPYVDNSYKWAGGGFLSTAEDLNKFGNDILYSVHLKEQTLSDFLTPQYLSDGKSTNYGIGFRVNEDKKGRRWFGHSGGSVGGTTMWMVFPEEELVITTITNIGRANWKDLAFRISNQFLK
jgi:CubicO group peptidase (beta-lactamase class C family)